MTRVSAITYEIAKIVDHDRKRYVSTFAAKTTTNILVDRAIKERAAVLMNLGVKALDALHIACAERAGATVLITTDDAPEKHYEPPQRYNFHTNREPCCMV